MKELAAANKLYKENIEEEKRQKRAREKEECAKVKAEERRAIDARKAARAAAKQAHDSPKDTPQFQRGKPTTSKASAVELKPVRRAVSARSRPKPATPPAPRTHKLRSGRTATLYN